MWYSLVAYIKFLYKSTNQHAVHSPFVFDLVTKCFYDNKKYFDYKHLVSYKNELLKNKNKIEIFDLGSGSRIAKSNIRVISQIAKQSGSTIKRTKLLYRLTQYFQFNNILELGTSLGISTHALSLSNPEARITTIEGCPNISELTKHNFQKFNLKNIELVTGNFNDLIKNQTNNTFDFIFFDGNHQKEATLGYFESLIKTAHNETVFIFDDIYWSKEMTEAWEIIKQHSKTTVSIDTFYWGIVFFRKEQAKEHFTIRL